MHKLFKKNESNIEIGQNFYRKNEFRVFKLFRSCWLFLFFSFVNAFLPIVLCIIASTIPFIGTETMIGISFSSPFQLIFLNIPFILTFWFILFVIKMSRKNNLKRYSFKEMFWIVLFYNVIIGVVLSFIFFAASYCYIHFFYYGTNSIDVAKLGEEFVFVFTPVILISSISYVFTFFLFFKFGSNKTAILEFVRLFIIISFCFLFGHVTNLKSFGIGLGVLVGSILSLLINFLVSFFAFRMWKYKFNYNRLWVIYAIKNSWKIIIIKVFGSMTKPLIFFVLGGTKSFQDYDFVVAKSIWYFILYFIPFFSDGISKMFSYHKILHGNSYLLTHKTSKQINLLFLINLFVLSIISIIFYFIVDDISQFLIINQESLIEYAIINKPLESHSIDNYLLLPTSLTTLFTIFYCICNNVNQIITDIRPMFEKEKEKKLIPNIVIIIVVIGFILGIGMPLIKMPIIGGLSAFSFAMFLITFIFVLLGMFNWYKLIKKQLNTKYFEI